MRLPSQMEVSEIRQEHITRPTGGGFADVYKTTMDTSKIIAVKVSKKITGIRSPEQIHKSMKVGYCLIYMLLCLKCVQ